MAFLGAALGGVFVGLCVTIPASLDRWSPTAAYGVALVGVVAAAVAFSLIDRRSEAAAGAQDDGDC